jgi:hypothetical protein
MKDPRGICPECPGETIVGERPNDCMCCAGYVDGVRNERASVVAWLREEYPIMCDQYDDAIGQIEMGEHDTVGHDGRAALAKST